MNRAKLLYLLFITLTLEPVARAQTTVPEKPTIIFVHAFGLMALVSRLKLKRCKQRVILLSSCRIQ
jgi:hypothetical protein